MISASTSVEEISSTVQAGYVKFGVGLDAAQLVERSARLDLSGLDFGSFAEEPLDSASLRCLRYMHDVEAHTICYLRDLLVTRAHRDPEVTDFLACWCYEEHWHGDAIGKVLEAHGEPSGSRVAAMRRRLPRRDAWRPYVFGAVSSVTRDAVAVFMSWGAINELVTQTAYARLAQCAGHPVLSELLRRIMRQEGRHIDFYTAQARRRLQERASARKLARASLRLLWEPVGTSVMPASEANHLATHLFFGPDGEAAYRRVDKHIDRLPGLAGLSLFERAVGKQMGSVIRSPL